MAALRLEIVEGPGRGGSFPLSGALLVGRGADAGLRLDDEHVDELHLRVTPEGDGALVEDLGERGGTFVNDAELHVPTRIRTGDEIQLGVTVLRLGTAAARPEPRPVPPPLRVPQPPPTLLPDEVLEQHPATPTLDALLDKRTKTKARVAPLALFVLVVFAVLIFLATSDF